MSEVKLFVRQYLSYLKKVSLTKVSNSKMWLFQFFDRGPQVLMGVSVLGRLIFLWFKLAHVGFNIYGPIFDL